MLTYQTMGPNAAGKYLVTYPTPGCKVLTVACECSTAEQAAGEVSRLNAAQMTREQAIQFERGLCGLRPACESRGGQ